MTAVQIELRLLELATTATGADPIAKRRAISSAYYAVFHALARVATQEFIGEAEFVGETRDTSRPDIDAYTHVYRQLDHGTLKKIFDAKPLADNQTLRKIGTDAVALQSERLRADYLPSADLYSNAKFDELIAIASRTVQSIQALSPTERRMLSVYLLFKKRPT